jgi:c-di-GMP-binding flagellar brake protein YcgR
MSHGSNRSGAGTRAFDEELTVPANISEMFAAIRSAGVPVFVTDTGTGAAFLSRILNVDDGRHVFTIGQIIPEGSLKGTGIGTIFQMLASVEDADFSFETVPLNAMESTEGWRELRFPQVVHRLRRRREYRGPGFGMAEVYLYRKGAPRDQGQKVRLRDISDHGVGITLLERGGMPIEAGAVFDDCLLLLNGNPVAACAIEIVHVRSEADTSSLIAGGRFLDLDAVSQKRISMLVTTVQCEELKRKRAEEGSGERPDA